MQDLLDTAHADASVSHTLSASDNNLTGKRFLLLTGAARFIEADEINLKTDQLLQLFTEGMMKHFHFEKDRVSSDLLKAIASAEFHQLFQQAA